MNNSLLQKEKKLTNYFTPPPSPGMGIYYGPVEQEYEEMSMMEIMNGNVMNCSL